MNDSNGSFQKTPLVEARSITKHFPIVPSYLQRLLGGAKKETVHAVESVDLAIYPGETVGLVGESGSGKTTLGRVMTRLHNPTSGDIYFQGSPLSQDMVMVDKTRNGEPIKPTKVKFFRLAQMIFQNPYSSLNPRKTLRDIIGTPLRHRGINDPLEREDKVVQLLRRVGLHESRIDAYPHQFSGGQRQRIGIARALAMHPRFIVADEPVSSLDVSIQAQVINLLEELQEEFFLTYLFIAHDLSVIYYISDRVAVMYLGHIMETGPTDSLFGEPYHPYTKALMAAIPRVNKAARKERIILPGDVPSPLNPPSGCPFHPRCSAKVGKVCEQELPPFFEVGGQKVACWIYEGHPVAGEEKAGEAKPQTVGDTV
jgi:oligopeptide/dipeptide ABC transporter ATP-binding protein